MKGLASTWPTQMRQKFRNLEDLARFCFPEGSTIRCIKCQIERSCTSLEIVGWMKDGYPKCKQCGQRTELDNPHATKR